ncbi:MAG: hypothetical protein CFH26_00224 [Alphaproteobacteria bacterium MarineAlpha6_Bin4]|nr:MAG: hypothetical protein CFH26_00224 [Alphaproteobacteria bacterium MarineAlpha6_Bin4]|tara:strand:+ start:10009 stop:10266 length:258 start_codon:yes stop_codon:yes gene_type:complete
MKKLSFIFLALIAIFVNSTAYAVEARTPTVSISQALQDARSKDNFATLKSAKFDVKEKLYNITYLTKDGDFKTIKISKVSGKEVK